MTRKPSLIGNLFGLFEGTTDVNVVEKNIGSEGKNIDTDTLNLAKNVEILGNEVVRVGNVTRLPFTLVGRVGKFTRLPLALVVRVRNERTFPWTTAMELAFRIVNERNFIRTIFLFVPISWLDSIGIRNHKRHVNIPVGGHDSIRVWNHLRCVLIPIIRLGIIDINDCSFRQCLVCSESAVPAFLPVQKFLICLLRREQRFHPGDFKFHLYSAIFKPIFL